MGVMEEDPSGQQKEIDDDLAPAFVDPENLDGEVLADLDEDDEEPEEDNIEEDDDEGPHSGPPGDGDGGEEEEEDMMMEAEVPDDSLIVLRDGHSDAVVSVAWHPSDPSVAASGGCDDKAFLWRVAGDGPEATVDKVELTGHSDTVACLGFSSDGSQLATGGLDGKVLIWDSQGKQTCCLEGPAGGVECLRWHPRGPVLLAGCEDFSAWMWNANTGACMQVFTGHSASVCCGAFTPDGKTVITASADATVRIWDPKSAACSATIQGHGFHEGAVTCMDVSRDGGLILSGSEDTTLRVSTTQGGKVKGTLAGHSDSVEAAALAGGSLQQGTAASGSMDGTIMLWDLQSLSARLTIDVGNKDGVVQLAWHPTDPIVFAASLDGILRAYDCRTGNCVSTLGGHTAGIQSISVRGDGKCILSGSDDHTIRIFSASS